MDELPGSEIEDESSRIPDPSWQVVTAMSEELWESTDFPQLFLHLQKADLLTPSDFKRLKICSTGRAKEEQVRCLLNVLQGHTEKPLTFTEFIKVLKTNPKHTALADCLDRQARELLSEENGLQVKWKPLLSHLAARVDTVCLCRSLAVQLLDMSQSASNDLVSRIQTTQASDPSIVAKEILQLWLKRTPGLINEERLNILVITLHDLGEEDLADMIKRTVSGEPQNKDDDKDYVILPLITAAVCQERARVTVVKSTIRRLEEWHKLSSRCDSLDHIRWKSERYSCREAYLNEHDTMECKERVSQKFTNEETTGSASSKPLEMHGKGRDSHVQAEMQMQEVMPPSDCQGEGVDAEVILLAGEMDKIKTWLLNNRLIDRKDLVHFGCQKGDGRNRQSCEDIDAATITSSRVFCLLPKCGNTNRRIFVVAKLQPTDQECLLFALVRMCIDISPSWLIFYSDEGVEDERFRPGGSASDEHALSVPVLLRSVFTKFPCRADLEKEFAAFHVHYVVDVSEKALSRITTKCITKTKKLFEANSQCFDTLPTVKVGVSRLDKLSSSAITGHKVFLDKWQLKLIGFEPFTLALDSSGATIHPRGDQRCTKISDYLHLSTGLPSFTISPRLNAILANWEGEVKFIAAASAGRNDGAKFLDQITGSALEWWMNMKSTKDTTGSELPLSSNESCDEVKLWLSLRPSKTTLYVLVALEGFPNFMDKEPTFHASSMLAATIALADVFLLPLDWLPFGDTSKALSRFADSIHLSNSFIGPSLQPSLGLHCSLFTGVLVPIILSDGKLNQTAKAELADTTKYGKGELGLAQFFSDIHYAYDSTSFGRIRNLVPERHSSCNAGPTSLRMLKLVLKAVTRNGLRLENILTEEGAEAIISQPMFLLDDNGRADVKPGTETIPNHQLDEQSGDKTELDITELDYRCPHLCSIPGICHITDRADDLQHPAQRLVGTGAWRLQCTFVLKDGAQTHDPDSSHSCGREHRCNRQCPPCSENGKAVFCTMVMGHAVCTGSEFMSGYIGRGFADGTLTGGHHFNCEHHLCGKSCSVLWNGELCGQMCTRALGHSSDGGCQCSGDHTHSETDVLPGTVKPNVVGTTAGSDGTLHSDSTKNLHSFEHQGCGEMYATGRVGDLSSGDPARGMEWKGLDRCSATCSTSTESDVTDVTQATHLLTKGDTSSAPRPEPLEQGTREDAHLLSNRGIPDEGHTVIGRCLMASALCPDLLSDDGGNHCYQQEVGQQDASPEKSVSCDSCGSVRQPEEASVGVREDCGHEGARRLGGQTPPSCSGGQTPPSCPTKANGVDCSVSPVLRNPASHEDCFTLVSYSDDEKMALIQCPVVCPAPTADEERGSCQDHIPHDSLPVGEEQLFCWHDDHLFTCQHRCNKLCEHVVWAESAEEHRCTKTFGHAGWCKCSSKLHACKSLCTAGCGKLCVKSIEDHQLCSGENPDNWRHGCELAQGKCCRGCTAEKDCHKRCVLAAMHTFDHGDVHPHQCEHHRLEYKLKKCDEACHLPGICPAEEVDSVAERAPGQKRHCGKGQCDVNHWWGSNPEQEHHCSAPAHEHTCEISCQLCGALCHNPYRHEDYVHSVQHRLVLPGVVENVRCGENFDPLKLSMETKCEDICRLSGRHFHRVKCPGEEICDELSGMEQQRRIHEGNGWDLVSHSLFWELQEMVDPQSYANDWTDIHEEDEHKLCTAVCHPDCPEQTFCSLPLFHHKVAPRHAANKEEDNCVGTGYEIKMVSGERCSHLLRGHHFPNCKRQCLSPCSMCKLDKTGTVSACCLRYSHDQTEDESTSDSQIFRVSQHVCEKHTVKLCDGSVCPMCLAPCGREEHESDSNHWCEHKKIERWVLKLIGRPLLYDDNRGACLNQSLVMSLTCTKICQQLGRKHRHIVGRCKDSKGRTCQTQRDDDCGTDAEHHGKERLDSVSHSFFWKLSMWEEPTMGKHSGQVVEGETYIRLKEQIEKAMQLKNFAAEDWWRSEDLATQNRLVEQRDSDVDSIGYRTDGGFYDDVTDSQPPEFDYEIRERDIPYFPCQTTHAVVEEDGAELYTDGVTARYSPGALPLNTNVCMMVRKIKEGFRFNGVTFSPQVIVGPHLGQKLSEPLTLSLPLDLQKDAPVRFLVSKTAAKDEPDWEVINVIDGGLQRFQPGFKVFSQHVEMTIYEHCRYQAQCGTCVVNVRPEFIYFSVSAKLLEFHHLLLLRCSAKREMCEQPHGDYRLCHDADEIVKVQVVAGDTICVSIASFDGSILQLNSPFYDEWLNRPLKETFDVAVPSSCSTSLSENGGRGWLSSFSSLFKRSEEAGAAEKEDSVRHFQWLFGVPKLRGDGCFNAHARCLREVDAGGSSPSADSPQLTFTVKHHRYREELPTNQATAPAQAKGISPSRSGICLLKVFDRISRSFSDKGMCDSLATYLEVTTEGHDFVKEFQVRNHDERDNFILLARKILKEWMASCQNLPAHERLAVLCKVLCEDMEREDLSEKCLEWWEHYSGTSAS